MNNDPFEQIRRMQDTFNKINLPFEQIQRQLNLVNNRLSPAINELRLTSEAVSSKMQAFMQNKDLLRTVSMVNESLQYQTDQWQLITNKMSQFQSLQIPDLIYPRLEELSSALLDVLPEEDCDDSLYTVPDVQHDDQATREPWTWETLKWFLGVVLPIVFAFYLSVLSSQQLEQHHQENIQQREKHHNDIMAEQQKQTQLLEARNEQIKRLEDALNALTKTLTSFITNSSNDLEYDQSNSPSE